MDPGYSTMPEKSHFGGGSHSQKNIALNGQKLNYSQKNSVTEPSMMSTLKIDDYSTITQEKIKNTLRSKSTTYHQWIHY